MLGLNRKTVKLVPYNKKWGEKFHKEKRRLQKRLGDVSMGIEHVGSTAIPGIHAKPIVDILVGVKSIQEAKRCIEPLKSLGYEHKKERGEKEKRLLFVKESRDKTTHLLHLVKYRGEIWQNQLLFVQYLRAHKPWARKYDREKKVLAKKFRNDRDSYTKSKSNLICKIIKLAQKKYG